jgi:hypothetical protein
MILESMGVAAGDFPRHVWEVKIELGRREGRGKQPLRIRRTTIVHQGQVMFRGEADVR